MKKPAVSRSTTTNAHVDPEAAAPRHAAGEGTADDLRQAYERVEPECRSLTNEELAKVNVDLTRAIGIVHEALPAVMAQRDELATLPKFDIGKVDRLRDYTDALWYIDLLSQIGHEITVSLPDLAAETARARDGLLISARPLARAGIISAADLDTIAKSTGYLAIANDVVRLCIIYHAAWDELAGRTMVTRAEIDAASTLAGRLAHAAQHREFAPARIPEPLRNRQRAYTLFRRAYDETRWGLEFLRRYDGDADVILPSIFNRGARYTATAANPRDTARPSAEAATTVPETPPRP